MIAYKMIVFTQFDQSKSWYNSLTTNIITIVTSTTTSNVLAHSKEMYNEIIIAVKSSPGELLYTIFSVPASIDLVEDAKCWVLYSHTNVLMHTHTHTHTHSRHIAPNLEFVSFLETVYIIPCGCNTLYYSQKYNNITLVLTLFTFTMTSKLWCDDF